MVILAAWNHSQLPEVARTLQLHLPPFDELFLNSGLWRDTPFRVNLSSAVDQLRPFHGLMKDPQKKPTWLTTTRQASYLVDPLRLDDSDTGSDGFGSQVLSRVELRASIYLQVDRLERKCLEASLC